MSIKHRTWCDPAQCTATEHIRTAQSTIPGHGMATVSLIEHTGPQPRVIVYGTVSAPDPAGFPEAAAGLARALAEHAGRAGSAPRTAGRMAALIGALDDVPVSDAERTALLRLCGLDGDVARHVAALITRARRNSSAGR